MLTRRHPFVCFARACRRLKRIDKKEKGKKLKKEKDKDKDVTARKSLNSVRVIQRNLVYITNISASLAKEEARRRRARCVRCVGR